MNNQNEINKDGLLYSLLKQHGGSINTDKRTEWIKEVKKVRIEQGLNWKEALIEASKKRKEANVQYKTTKERHKLVRDERNTNYSNCKLETTEDVSNALRSYYKTRSRYKK